MRRVGGALVSPGYVTGTLALLTRLFALFAGRILSHAERAAEVLAQTNTRAQTLDQPMGFADCAIAARASAHGCAAATRNMRDFKRAGMSVIGPWRSGKARGESANATQWMRQQCGEGLKIPASGLPKRLVSKARKLSLTRPGTMVSLRVQEMVTPLSTAMMCPVMARDSSEAR